MSGQPRHCADIGASFEQIVYERSAEIVRAEVPHPGQVAALILEPVATGLGVEPPRKGYLQSLRGLALEHGALVVFDETTTVDVVFATLTVVLDDFVEPPISKIITLNGSPLAAWEYV